MPETNLDAQENAGCSFCHWVVSNSWGLFWIFLLEAFLALIPVFYISEAQLTCSGNWHTSVIMLYSSPASCLNVVFLRAEHGLYILGTLLLFPRSVSSNTPQFDLSVLLMANLCVILVLALEPIKFFLNLTKHLRVALLGSGKFLLNFIRNHQAVLQNDCTTH